MKNTDFCTEDYARKCELDPIGCEEPTAQQMQQALKEASELGHEAYEVRNKTAIFTAERILYIFHRRNAFAQPIHSISSVVWNTLARMKLQATLVPYMLESANLTPTEMRTHIDAALKEMDQKDHPMLDQIASSKSLHGLQVYGKNWEAHAAGFTHHLVSLTQRTVGSLQKMVAKMIIEELLPPVDHDNLRARFMKSIKVEFNPESVFVDPEITLEALSLMNYRTAVSLNPNPFFTFGSFYSIEAGLPSVCSRLLKGLRDRGIDEHSLEFLILHGEVDILHSSEWIDALQAAPLSAKDRQSVVAGALGQIQLRREMFNAIKVLV